MAQNSLQLRRQLVGAAGPAACADEDTLLLAIQPSSCWTAADVQHISSIIQRRNMFVCMQLVQMVKEQYSKVAAAAAGAAGADSPALLHAAAYTFLATLTSSSTGTVLAAALFYPRASSKDQLDIPHMYVELICTNSPGKGLGSLLLQHIEQFVSDNCDSISEGFFGGVPDAAGAATHPGACPAPAVCHGMDVGRPAISSSSEAAAENNPSTAQRRSYSSLPVLLASDAPITATEAAPACLLPVQLPAGMCQSGSTSSISSLASNLSTSTAWDCSCEAAPPQAPGAAGATAAGGGSSSNLAGNGSSSSSLCRSCNLIQGIKLLSVESAQAFYTKCGYGAPDSCCEMFKPLPALRHNNLVPAGLAPCQHQAAF
jgi:hypothetical protein